MIYDCMLFNGEFDMLKLHLQVLSSVVDRFVIVESAYTFSGKERNIGAFLDHIDMYYPWTEKIIHLMDGRRPSDNRWENEKYQRNNIMRGLNGADQNDTILISDVDEIANPEDIIRYEFNGVSPVVFETNAYYYYLDYLMVPQEITTTRCIMMGKKRMISTPQEFREKRLSVQPIKGGWHFSYLGGPKAIAEKIASFSHAEYDSEYYRDPIHIKHAMEAGIDLFDRQGICFQSVPIQYPTHPRYLVDHQDEYAQYISPSMELS